MNYLSIAFIRSPRGQATLFVLTFLGALGLAVVTLCLRNVFFERYVYEKHPAIEDRTKIQATDLAKLDKPEPTALTPKERNEVYGAIVNSEMPDPDHRIGRFLLATEQGDMLKRLRRTLVAGNPAQRRQALELLRLVTQRDLLADATALARYALTRAERRGEDDLAQSARDALTTLAAAP